MTTSDSGNIEEFFQLRRRYTETKFAVYRYTTGDKGEKHAAKAGLGEAQPPDQSAINIFLEIAQAIEAFNHIPPPEFMGEWPSPPLEVAADATKEAAWIAGVWLHQDSEARRHYLRAAELYEASGKTAKAAEQRQEAARYGDPLDDQLQARIDETREALKKEGELAPLDAIELRLQLGELLLDTDDAFGARKEFELAEQALKDLTGGTPPSADNWTADTLKLLDSIESFGDERMLKAMMGGTVLAAQQQTWARLWTDLARAYDDKNPAEAQKYRDLLVQHRLPGGGKSET